LPGVEEDSDSVEVVEELLGTVGFTGVELELGELEGPVGLTGVEDHDG
jgi:hypothetical protein